MRIPQKPSWLMWDHNMHYYDFLLRQIPPGAQRALDVGCGTGLLATRLAEQVPDVIAIDRDSDTIRAARATSASGNVQFVEADVFEADLRTESFDFVSCVAALHHMPLRAGLERLASLVAPGGVLAVFGLYSPASPFDYAYAAVTGLLDLAVGVVRHRAHAGRRWPPGVVIDVHTTLNEVRRATRSILPGATLRRHIYHRYSVVYSRHATVNPAEVVAREDRANPA